MAFSRNTVLIAIVVLLAVSIQPGASLKCFDCNSMMDGKCADPFEPDTMTHVERQLLYKDCPQAPLNLLKLNGTTRPVCQKLITKTGNRRIFARSCTHEAVAVAADFCRLSRTQVPFIEMEFCETCSTDGCNAGSHLIPTWLALFSILPIVAMVRNWRPLA